MKRYLSNALVLFAVLTVGIASCSRMEAPIGGDEARNASENAEMETSAPEYGDVSAADHPAAGPNDAALATEAGAELPLFELPAPRPSARATLPRDLVLTKGPTLKNVADAITDRLGGAGYADSGFYRTSDGFAIATRMERIHPDGRPYPGDQRWNILPTGLLTWHDGFSVRAFLTALTNADPGHYRVLVFVVTDKPVTRSSDRMSRDTATGLADSGAAALPVTFANAQFNESYTATALVYEFIRPSLGAGADLSIPSAVPGSIHLKRSGLLP
jgi:hypothetical protein